MQQFIWMLDTKKCLLVVVHDSAPEVYIIHAQNLRVAKVINYTPAVADSQRKSCSVSLLIARECQCLTDVCKLAFG